MKEFDKLYSLYLELISIETTLNEWQKNLGTIKANNPSSFGSSQHENNGLEILFINEERYIQNYKTKLKEYDEQFSLCKELLNKIEKPIDKLIAELSFINKKTTKEVSNILSLKLNKECSNEYILQAKTRAKKIIDKII